MAKPFNALAGMASHAGATPAAAKPAPVAFPGIGAQVQNRPGQSLEQLATAMHPKFK